MKDAIIWACGEDRGRRIDDPIVRAVTEGRIADGYSSCADLSHWVRHLAGLRDEVNRRESGRHQFGSRAMQTLTAWPMGRNRVATTAIPEPATWEDGDILVLDAHLASAHTCVVVEVTEDEVVTGDYGQHPLRGQRPEHIAARMRRRQLVRQGSSWQAREESGRGRDISSYLRLRTERQLRGAEPVMSLNSWQSAHSLNDAPTIPAPPPSSARRRTEAPNEDGVACEFVDVSKWQAPSRFHYERLGGYAALVARIANGNESDDRGIDHLLRARGQVRRRGAYLNLIPWRSAETLLSVFARAWERAGLGVGSVLPILSIESWRSASGVDRFATRQWLDLALELLEHLSAEYGGAIWYCNPSDYARLGSPPELLDYPLWLADYRKPRPETLPWTMLQYTGTGYRPALYDGDLDLNVARSLPIVGLPAPAPAPRPPQLIPLEVDWESHWRERARHIQRETDEGKHG